MTGNTYKFADFQIDLNKRLGSGGFGSVYKGIDERTDSHVAAKCINLRNSKKREEFAMREVIAMEVIAEHPNVVIMLNSNLDKTRNELWIVTEYCELGDLSDYIKTKDHELDEVLSISHDCACGLEYMNNHKPQNIIHRDVKPGNILMTSSCGRLTAKLSDFGLAKVMSPAGNQKMSTELGSWYYMAPEFFRTSIHYDKSVDVFSLGIVILQLLNVLLTGENDLEAEEVRSDVNIAIALNEDNKFCPVRYKKSDTFDIRKLKTLIQYMVQHEPSERLPIERVKMELGDHLQQIKHKKSQTTLDIKAPTDLVLRRSSISDCKSITLESMASEALKLDLKSLAPPLVTEQGYLTLTFDADVLVGMGGKGEILLEDSKEKFLYKYQFIQDHYELKWKKAWPEEMIRGCRKYISHSGEICLKYGSCSSTVRYNRSLKHLNDEDHNGELIACLYNKARSGHLSTDTKTVTSLAYRRKIKEKHYQIRLKKISVSKSGSRDKSGISDMTLKPPGHVHWNLALSVCSSMDQIVVVEANSKSLDIFSHKGEHQIHTDLDYMPLMWNAVTATQQRIIVAQYGAPVTLQIHNWSGELLYTLTHEDLGLRAKDCIHALKYDQNGLLHVVIGRVQNYVLVVTAIHAFEIENVD